MEEQPRILIVEDDAGVAQGLVNGLKQAGFEPVLLSTASRGCRVF